MNRSSSPVSSSHAPHPAIGFTAIHSGTAEEVAKSQQALHHALTHFDTLTHRSLEIGQTRLTLWGRGNLEDCCHLLPDGSLLVLIGSPSGRFTWEAIEEKILSASPSEPFILPWEGRVILLRIDPVSNNWTLWNDWVGSIPVFHAQRGNWRVASTLEPAVVEMLGVSEQDIFLPGLLALLLWGHYFSDWTLFKDMKVVPPDCEAHWEEQTFRASIRYSVSPSEQHHNTGWDEMIDEMYVLSRDAIASVLKEQPQWVLPLSSGMDSRLIAGVAAKLNTNVHAYTWGLPKNSDVIHAKRIAQVLGIPWKHLHPGNTFLTAYRVHWADLFGSATHFHGMYQMPFLDAVRTDTSAPILSGYIGELLAGYDTKLLCDVNASQYPYQLIPDEYLHWTVDEAWDLMNFSVEDGFCELAAATDGLCQSIPGPLHQQLRFLTLWGRQRHFTYFQSMMSDYWLGVATPYLNRNYARFVFSLPRSVLDHRILQRSMLARYYPKLAAIPGTYAPEPALLTGSYLLKKRVAKSLPQSISKSIFPDIYRIKSPSDVGCVLHDGKKSFYPLFERLDRLANWVNIDAIEKNYLKIVAENNGKAVRKLQSLQTLAYRLPA